jgi:hypothetical protein
MTDLRLYEHPDNAERLRNFDSIPYSGVLEKTIWAAESGTADVFEEGNGIRSYGGSRFTR